MSEKQTPVPTGEVHPIAELFPMLEEEELDDLARHIKANGLQEKIVLDEEGTLIDGRNRLEACRRAGVDPEYTTLNGDDPIAYILGANAARRHLTSGQRAMAVAQAMNFPSGTKVPKGVKGQLAQTYGFDQSRLSHALLVLEYAPSLADLVMSKKLTLTEAAADARIEKARQESAEDRATRYQKELDKLRELAPDLAELVANQTMTIEEALAAWQVRSQQERERRENTVRYFEGAATMLWGLLREDPEKVVRDWIDDRLKVMEAPGNDVLKTGDGLRELAARVTTLADAVDERGGLG